MCSYGNPNVYPLTQISLRSCHAYLPLPFTRLEVILQAGTISVLYIIVLPETAQSVEHKVGTNLYYAFSMYSGTAY